MEKAWRGDERMRESMEKMEYQALRKCTGAYSGAPKEKVKAIAGVQPFGCQTGLDASALYRTDDSRPHRRKEAPTGQLEGGRRLRQQQDRSEMTGGRSGL